MTCPKGNVKIGRGLALKVLDWHGGQWYPTYAVGSSGLAGRCVSKQLLFEASNELRITLRSIEGGGHLYTAKEQRELTRLVETLRKKALPYAGSD
jgi:hypothetical protein